LFAARERWQNRTVVRHGFADLLRFGEVHNSNPVTDSDLDLSQISAWKMVTVLRKIVIMRFGLSGEHGLRHWPALKSLAEPILSSLHRSSKIIAVICTINDLRGCAGAWKPRNAGLNITTPSFGRG